MSQFLSKNHVEHTNECILWVQVKGDAEKQKSKQAKELANMRHLSLETLKEADLKIQNIESKLAKEREDHRNQVKVLEDDAQQVGARTGLQNCSYSTQCVQNALPNFFFLILK